MSDNYRTLGPRWFNLAADLAKTCVRGMVMVEERTLDITRELGHQIEAVQVSMPHLLEEFSGELKRTQLLVEETTRTLTGTNLPVPRMVNGRFRVIRELPEPDEEIDESLN